MKMCFFQGLTKARPNLGTTFHGGFNLPKSNAYEVDLAARKFQAASEILNVQCC